MTQWPLSTAFPLTLLASVAVILAFDIVAASFARGRPTFKYGRLWPLQFGFYVVIGFFAMLALLDLRLVEVVGAFTGFVEATLGWAITWRMGPARVANATPRRIAVAIVSMTVFGFGFAIIGALAFNAIAAALLRGHH